MYENIFTTNKKANYGNMNMCAHCTSTKVEVNPGDGAKSVSCAAT